MNTLLALGVVLLQIAAGVVISLTFLGNYLRSAALTLGVGAALGTFLSMLCSVLLHGTVVTDLAWAVPAAIGLVLILTRWSSITESARALQVTRPEIVGIGVTLVVALPLVILGWVRTPVSAIARGASVDMYFFEALANGIANFGPANSILMTDGSLRYHWFAYAWAGELSAAAGLPSFIALTRILPVLTLIGATLLAVGWASTFTFGRVKSPWWVPSLAGLLVAVGGYTGALYGGILNVDSPSQSLSTVWLVALVALVTVYLTQGEATSRASGQVMNLRGVHVGFLLLIALLTIATVGGKASSTAVAISGMLLVNVVGILRRQPWWRASLVVTVVMVASAALTYLWVLSGVSINDNLTEAASVRASTWQQLDPLVGTWGPLLGTLGLSLAVLARFGGFLWLGADRSARFQPSVLLTAGAVIAGLGALFALRGGINDLWFVLAASAPAAVVSAYGVGQAAQWLQEKVSSKSPFSPVSVALGVSVVAGIMSLLFSLNWNVPSSVSADSLFTWPGLLYWLAAVSPWILIPVLSALAVWLLVPRLTSRNGLAAVIALTSISLTLTSIITRPAALWTQSRHLVTDIGIVTQDSPAENEAATGEVVVGAEPALVDQQIQAAEWLTEHSTVSDIVATSGPFTAQIPALTGRQMYIAGAQYQRGLGDSAQVADVDRKAQLSEKLLTESWDLAVAEMCGSGVTWIWIESTDVSHFPVAPTFSEGNVHIFSAQILCDLATAPVAE